MIFSGIPIVLRMVHRAWWSTESKAALRSMKSMYRCQSLQNSHCFSAVSQTADIWSTVEWLGMKPACCSLCFWWMASRAWVRRMWVNNLPSIKSSVIPQWLLQISLSPLCFQNGSITPCLQSSSSLIQTDMDKHSLSHSLYLYSATFDHSLPIHSWADSLLFLCKFWYCNEFII